MNIMERKNCNPYKKGAVGNEMMPLNIILFVGLAIAVPMMLLGFILWLIGLSVRFIDIMGIAGYFASYLFIYMAAFLFVYGSFKYLIYRTTDFWNDLYPLNFGIALLAMCIITYGPQYPLLPILEVFVLSVISAIILDKLKLTEYRLFLLLLIISIIMDFSALFKERSFYIGFAQGIIFIVLAVLNGVSKTISESFKSSTRRLRHQGKN